jgi:hypothetical protein
MAVNAVRINPERNVITDDLLDTLGREWSFDHVKGLNELLKKRTLRLLGVIRLRVPIRR